MAEKFFEGKVPKVQAPANSRAGFNLPSSKDISAKVENLQAELEKSIPNFDFVSALSKVWEVINLANKHIEDSRPWVLAKEKNDKELSAVIYMLLEVLRAVSVAIGPFMPQTAENIWKQLGLKGELGKSDFSPGASISKSAPLFPRIEM